VPVEVGEETVDIVGSGGVSIPLFGIVLEKSEVVERVGSLGRGEERRTPRQEVEVTRGGRWSEDRGEESVSRTETLGWRV